MSTRCQIIVEGSDVVLYRHSDGYPDGKCGVLKSLKAIVSNFHKLRGHDELYLPAHIVADMIAAHKKWTNGLVRQYKKEGKNTQSLEECKLLGYGVEAYNPDADNALHGDIEFLYIVQKDGTIEVRSCFKDRNGPCNIGNTTLVKTDSAN